MKITQSEVDVFFAEKVLLGEKAQTLYEYINKLKEQKSDKEYITKCERMLAKMLSLRKSMQEHYDCVKVIETDKYVSTLKTLESDGKGYYKVLLGTINAYDIDGTFYSNEGMDSIINDPTGLFRSTLTDGRLLLEVKRYIPTASDPLPTNEANACGHVREVTLVYTKNKSGGTQDTDVVEIYGWVKPTGPHSGLLKAALGNPKEKPKFAIRGITKDIKINGEVVKKMLTISTWDLVT